jgi:uncharacterized membrane protein YccC
MEKERRERELIEESLDLMTSLDKTAKLMQFSEMYETDPARAAKEFPGQFSRYLEEKQIADAKQKGEEKRDNAWERVTREAVDEGGAERIRIEELASNVDEDEFLSRVSEAERLGDA